MSMLEKAIKIAEKAHAGQTDLAGQPYIGHPLAVMSQMPTEQLKIIAVLHDVVEDNSENYSFGSLTQEGFSNDIISALISISRKKGENYWDYIRRVAENNLATEVKLADIAHNSDRSRIASPTPKDEARWAKYEKAKRYLTEIKEYKTQHPNIDLATDPYRFILHRRLFAIIREEYEALCYTLMLIVKAASQSFYDMPIVQGRVKKLDSFTEKCARKAKKYGNDNFKNMTDLCGIRVIFHTKGQVEEFCDFIKKSFVVDFENSLDMGSQLGDAEFGYTSQHYVVSVSEGVAGILGIPIDYFRFKNMKAEIQARTLAQHISAEVLHNRIYKPIVQPLNEHLREAARIAAIFENADEVLERFTDEYDSFSLYQTAYLTVKKTEDELQVLEAMNFGETDVFARFVNSLKMAAYLRSLGRYAETETVLREFIGEDGEPTIALDDYHRSKLFFEYGVSLLSKGAHLSLKSEDFINKALSVFEWLETDHSGKWLMQRRFQVFMLAYIGVLTKNVSFLERTLMMDFLNPYARAALLDAKHQDAGLVRSAASMAEKHLKAKINEPEVYFTLGRLWHSLGNESSALSYYADGCLFYYEKDSLESIDGIDNMRKNYRVRDVLNDEIQYYKDKSDNFAETVSRLLTSIYQNIYGIVDSKQHNVIFVLKNSQMLTAFAKNFNVSNIGDKRMAEQVFDISETLGYLFIEDEEDVLEKLALALGLKIVSVNERLNAKFVWDEKVRRTKRFYTLPYEIESLNALLTERTTTLDKAIIEQAAKNGHEKYTLRQIASMRQSGATPPDLGERTALWDILKDTYKNSNIDKVIYSSTIFESFGYEFTSDPDNEIIWDAIPDNIKLGMGKAEHGRWNADRVVFGWAYDTKRDNEMRNHPCITYWDNLSAEIQAYDFYELQDVLDDFREAGWYLHKKRP
jgi:ppGpp synthetase/RelA/SpoT-type nucleotidyltranferase